MSGEMIAIIAATIALAGVIVPGMRGMRRDMNRLEVRLTERMGALEAKFTERMGALEAKLTERMGALETKLTERMGALETQLTERIARLEGAFEGSTRGREPRKTRH
ncbi:hypothetical protein [Candidatus Palauibacter sp.]|uniref:hypothetical protein n=1 Tax=Candidatus Palauibacter sp. TaxID=3101350 RepID=UPI003B0230D5